MEGTYFGDPIRLFVGPALWKAAKKSRFYFFRKAEDMHRAVIYLGAYKRAMDRIENGVDPAPGQPRKFEPNKLMGGGPKHQRITQKEWVKREAVRSVGKTAAWYSAVNAPGIFRSPAGRL